MKNKICFVLLIIILLLFSYELPTKASTLGDINSDGKVNLTDAQLVLKSYLKISNTNSSINADIDGDGKVNLADAQLILKIYLKMYSVAQKNPLYEFFDLSNGLSYDLKKTSNYSVVCVVQNNNSFPIDLEATCVFYQGETMVDARKDSNHCLEPNGECVFEFVPYDTTTYECIDFDNYKVNFNTDKQTNVIYGASDIYLKADVGTDKVTVEFKNNSKTDFGYVKATVVFFGNFGEIISTEEHYIDCTKAGSIDYKTFDFPYSRKTYKTIKPKGYNVYIDFAYTYTWMQ